MKKKWLAMLIVVLAVFCIAADPWGAETVSGPLHFNVAATTAGNTELIPADANARYRLLSLTITGQNSTVTNIYLHSGGRALWCDSANPQPIDMTAISGIAGLSTGEHTSGWIETEYVGQALYVNSSAAQKVNFRGTYVKVK